MSTRTMSNVTATGLRILSILSFISVPAWVIYQKFPLWQSQGGSGAAIGSGAILLFVIVFVTFKKYILAFAREKLGTISAGVSLILLWSGLALACMLLAKLTDILKDFSTVFLWAAIGATVGVVLQCIARKIEKRGVDNGASDANGS